MVSQTQRPRDDGAGDRAGASHSDKRTVPSEFRGAWRLSAIETRPDRQFNAIDMLRVGFPPLGVGDGGLEFDRSVWIDEKSLTITWAASREIWAVDGGPGSGAQGKGSWEFSGTLQGGAAGVGAERLKGKLALDGDRIRLHLQRDGAEVAGIYRKFDRRRTTVIIVHGTYGGDDEWVREVRDHATFASELRRAMGPSVTHIEPFLWRSSIRHEVRLAAAANLAALIDSPKLADDRIVIIGHSHGGNVAMAAVGRAAREVDAVICLATPHFHLMTKRSEDNRVYYLPVYASFDARQRMGKLLNVQVTSDSVVEIWAKFRTGLDEPTAVAATERWRAELGHPSLHDDGGAIQEMFEDWLGIKLSDNLTVNSWLSASDRDIYLACDLEGEPAHNAIHSCRMGQILGGVLRAEFSDDALEYLAGTVIAEDADDGEPTSIEVRNAWWEQHRDGMHQSGWIVTDLKTETVAQVKPSGGNWDIDRSPPDHLVKITNHVGTTVTKSSLDSMSSRWQPHVHFPFRVRGSFTIHDADLLGAHDDMGTVPFTIDRERPGQWFSTGTASIELKWQAGHY